MLRKQPPKALVFPKNLRGNTEKEENEKIRRIDGRRTEEDETLGPCLLKPLHLRVTSTIRIWSSFIASFSVKKKKKKREFGLSL